VRDSLFSFIWKPFLPRANLSLVADELWRSISLFNMYRLILGVLAVFLADTLADALSMGTSNVPLFFRTAIVYVVLVLLSQLAIKLRHPRFGLQLAFQIGIDIACINVLSHASGGIQSGLGMLLLVSLAAAGLISRGKITLFFAALASIAVLLQHSYAVLVDDATTFLYLQSGLLSVAYFVTAWLTHTLAKYATVSEQLATVRGVDLTNMAEANRLLIEDMPDGVLVVDEYGVIRQCNPSAERLLGYTFPAVGSVTLEQCSLLLAAQFTAWRQDIAHKSEILRFTYHHQVHVRFLSVQRDGWGGAVVFLEDMQRAQAQAQQIKLAALGRLTANIAHEVRNPLTSISYATELLREEIHDPAQARLFQIISDNTVRLNRIVQDVMRLNQRDRVQAESIALCKMLPNFVATLCQAEHVELAIFKVEAIPTCMIKFDCGHLEQLLWNLCSNALRYCSKQSASVQLHVCRLVKGTVVLEIFDDGPGVAADVIAQLFEPFFTTTASGTGLGLYIARELCEANDAELEYVAQATGGGRFRVVFGGRYER